MFDRREGLRKYRYGHDSWIDTLRTMEQSCYRLAEDLAPAHWVVDRIHDFAVDVGSVVPEGFAAYARVFHPAWRDVGGERVPVSWATIAAANGRVVHPEMQWNGISGSWEHLGEGSPALWDREPDDGALPRPHAKVLRDVLTGHTGTPDKVWWCVWNGYGGNYTFTPVATTPLVRLPGREYFLLSGPIDCIEESLIRPFFWQTANLWWPDDGAWCVATEIDLAWTYVGASEDLIEELVAHPNLEALRTRIDHGITYTSDRVNPPPEQAPWR